VAESIDQLLDRAAGLLESGRKVALCLLVRAKGSTPASPGAIMLVDDAAELYGTVGGGCVEAEVRRRVFEMIGLGRTGLLQFKLDRDYGWDDGLICGGTIDVAVALRSSGRRPTPTGTASPQTSRSSSIPARAPIASAMCSIFRPARGC
jgi:xanthine/CO dehydrogenase XdhC/CoxF family maturation factor